MSTTQEHLLISDISDDILLLKNGGGVLVLEVSAVNFGLLSDREQIAIISSFAQMLNSLSFSIQIVILSERLNIASYLILLDRAQKAQTNPLLSQMMTDYKQFIQSTIKENEVLDKKFYIVVPLFSIELGITASKESLRQKIKTVLLPRRDQLIRQLNRVGLKTTQLYKTDLIKVFYNIYNGQVIEKPNEQTISPQQMAVKLKNPKIVKPPTTNIPIPQPLGQPSNMPYQPVVTQGARTHPFVVEELSE